MKKRRELDALVSGVKSRRKSSKSEHELLRYNGSESSDGDDFAVTGPKTRGTSLCSTCSSVFVFLLLVACLLVCAGLTWMHVEMKKDFEALRQGLAAVEGRKSINAEDIQKLFLQIELANKTLDQHGKRLSAAVTDVSHINATVRKLSDSMTTLSHGMKAAPELKQVPDKLNTVAKTLADLGSDVAGMKDTVGLVDPFIQEAKARLDNLTLQISDMKQSLSETTKPAPESELSPDLANLVQGLPGQMQLINSTMSAKLSVVMKSLSSFEDKFVELRNITDTLSKNMSTILTDHSSISADHSSITADHSSMTGDNQTAEGTVDVTSDQFKASVTEILQSMLSSMHSNTSDVSGTVNEPIPLDSGAVALRQQLEQLERAIQNLSSHDTWIQNINTSVVNVKQDVSHLSSVLVQQSNQVTNLSHHVTALQNYVTRIEHNMQSLQGLAKTDDIVEDIDVTPDLTAGGNSEVVSGQTDKPDTFEDVPQISNTGIVDIDQSNSTSSKPPTVSQQSVTSDKSEMSTPAPIKIAVIDSPEELDRLFSHWDRSGEGKITYDILPGFLGPNVPDEKDLQKFDEDHDGYYTQQEIAHALGFNTVVSTPSSTTTTEPPR